jgi:hypothetical protein
LDAVGPAAFERGRAPPEIRTVPPDAMDHGTFRTIAARATADHTGVDSRTTTTVG